MVGKRCLLILAGTIVLATILFFADAKQTLPQNQKGEAVLRRGGYGAGDIEEEVRAQVDGAEEDEDITVTIGEQEYRPEETQEVLETVSAKLETYILGENESLDRVRSNLNLVTEIPDTSIEVAWEVSDYKVMDATGEIHQENLEAGGKLITLTAVLSYNQSHVIEELPVCIYPPLLSDQEAVRKTLEEAVQKEEESSRTEEEVVLPSKVNGHVVAWSQPTGQRGLVILLLGGVMCVLVILADKEKVQQELKKRKRQMILDYPELVNQYILLLTAGMTAKNAWTRMVEEYEKKKEEAKIRYAYEEMMLTLREMQSGRTEAECYENFGKRCGLKEYRKFGAMLSQNLKKGSKGLVDILRQEAENAFEERKNNARKMGEEASTKLLLPMVLMLLVVFIIIIVPAFLSIQL